MLANSSNAEFVFCWSLFVVKLKKDELPFVRKSFAVAIDDPHLLIYCLSVFECLCLDFSCDERSLIYNMDENWDTLDKYIYLGIYKYKNCLLIPGHSEFSLMRLLSVHTFMSNVSKKDVEAKVCFLVNVLEGLFAEIDTGKQYAYFLNLLDILYKFSIEQNEAEEDFCEVFTYYAPRIHACLYHLIDTNLELKSLILKELELPASYMSQKNQNRTGTCSYKYNIVRHGGFIDLTIDVDRKSVGSENLVLNLENSFIRETSGKLQLSLCVSKIADLRRENDAKLYIKTILGDFCFDKDVGYLRFKKTLCLLNRSSLRLYRCDFEKVVSLKQKNLSRFLLSYVKKDLKLRSEKDLSSSKRLKLEQIAVEDLFLGEEEEGLLIGDS